MREECDWQMRLKDGNLGEIWSISEAHQNPRNCDADGNIRLEADLLRKV